MLDIPQSFTPIHELGEFNLIHKLTSEFTRHNNNLLCGVGDDAAVIQLSDNEVLLVSTDQLIENVHFDLSYTPPLHLGYKAVVSNLSDIYAMNGTPTSITVSIACSNMHSVELIQSIYEGIRLACDNYKIDLIGGDTSGSKNSLFISITVLGKGKKEDVVYRRGANVSDLICVTGNLGAAYAGFQILEREKRIFLENSEIQPDLSDYDYVLERQLKPEPREDIISFFKTHNIKPTSMIDLSDGLASELNHLAQASNLGFLVFNDKIPLDHQTISVADDFKIASSHYALYGGEDYELLFTISPKYFETLKLNHEITVIGYVTDNFTGVKNSFIDNSTETLEPLGYNHFKNQ